MLEAVGRIRVAVSGFHMWSQTYDRNLTDILKVQADVATSVAHELEAKLVGDLAGKIELGGTVNVRAHDAYLRGMHLLYRPNDHEAGVRGAVAAFDEAISFDPQYAAAFARKAGALDLLYLYYSMNLNDRETLQKQAGAAAERAVAIAPQFGEAHTALAVTREELLDFVGAAREFTRAVALAPGSAYAQRNFGRSAAKMGCFDVAIDAGRRAVILDPQNPTTQEMLGGILLTARRYNEALVEFQEADVLQPMGENVHNAFAYIFLVTGEFRKAQQMCELPASPQVDRFRHYCLAVAYHALGNQEGAERELNRAKILSGDIAFFDMAGVYALLGNTAEAMKSLLKAERNREWGLVELKTDWSLDPIRNEPEFKALVERMKFPSADDYRL